MAGYLKSAMRKLDSVNRMQAVAGAFRYRLLQSAWHRALGLCFMHVDFPKPLHTFGRHAQGSRSLLTKLRSLFRGSAPTRRFRK
ncbi:hypothetical protein [Rhizobium brockwellii]